MARKSIVQNLMDQEYVEKLKGKTYTIPARGEITLPRHEAVELVGSYGGYNVEKRLKIKHLADDKADTVGACICNVCGKSFGNERELEAHIEKDHPNSAKVFTCSFCKGVTFKTRKEVIAHLKTAHKDKNAADLLDAIDKAG